MNAHHDAGIGEPLPAPRSVDPWATTSGRLVVISRGLGHEHRHFGFDGTGESQHFEAELDGGSSAQPARLVRMATILARWVIPSAPPRCASTVTQRGRARVRRACRSVAT